MRTRIQFVLLVAVGVWLGGEDRITARFDSHVCEDKCSDGASCDAQCWRTQFEYDQDYPSTTCGAEGYSCCGDGACNPGNEGCNACTDDCGWVASCEVECNQNSDCDPGEVCNPTHECVPLTWSQDGPQTPQCGGSCTSNSDCCGNDLCIGAPGQKNCGIPSSTVLSVSTELRRERRLR